MVPRSSAGRAFVACISGRTTCAKLEWVLAMLPKDRCHSEAEVVFVGTIIKLANKVRPYMGSAIGSSLFVR